MPATSITTTAITSNSISNSRTTLLPTITPLIKTYTTMPPRLGQPEQSQVNHPPVGSAHFFWVGGGIRKEDLGSMTCNILYVIYPDRNSCISTPCGCFRIFDILFRHGDIAIFSAIGGVFVLLISCLEAEILPCKDMYP